MMVAIHRYIELQRNEEPRLHEVEALQSFLLLLHSAPWSLAFTRNSFVFYKSIPIYRVYGDATHWL